LHQLCSSFSSPKIRGNLFFSAVNPHSYSRTAGVGGGARMIGNPQTTKAD
jgi:hypothetical protein